MKIQLLVLRSKFQKEYSLQGSALGPILFNALLKDLFFHLKETDTISYADDTTPYAFNQNLDRLINRLQRDSLLSISMFESSYMKLNTDKFWLLISGYKY